MTHHSKKIVRFGNHSGLADTPALKAAKALYQSYIPQCPKRLIEPPYRVVVRFYFGDKNVKEPQWRIRKPDTDNANKLLMDELERKGWIDRDERVSASDIQKIDVPIGQEGITVTIVSLRHCKPIII